MSGTIRSAQINFDEPFDLKKLCLGHALDALGFGEEDHIIVEWGDCQKCYELSGRDPYDRDMTEPYEP